ncbi:hypothetical protein EVG20_g5064 [Dentipellis fragilis]|uniref:Uncharacterized protein n=1 Tax=Dentipellis fragilis TaxID=205917 RepID=A0A4Y9YUE6_9AGAM|nr:hypothetical protein EVG20_g5064 [Dentipellis fragilis]
MSCGALAWVHEVHLSACVGRHDEERFARSAPDPLAPDPLLVPRGLIPCSYASPGRMGDALLGATTDDHLGPSSIEMGLRMGQEPATEPHTCSHCYSDLDYLTLLGRSPLSPVSLTVENSVVLSFLEAGTRNGACVGDIE